MIYQIQNTINGKSYVGLTRHSFKKRYPGGKWWKYTSNILLKSDFQIYGESAFVVTILDDSHSSESEAHYASKLNTYHPNGYNLVKCVSGVQDDLVRANMSAIAQKRWNNPEERRLQSERRSGKQLSRQHREAMSVAQTGKKRSPETILKMSKKQSNRSDNHKQNISKAKNIPVGCSNGKEYISAKCAAEELGLSRAHISAVCNGKRKTTGGLIFWFLQK